MFQQPVVQFSGKFIRLWRFAWPVLLFCLICFAAFQRTVSPAHSQTDLRFQGPLVATASPEQDGLWIIDVSTGAERWYSFGPGDYYMGDFSPDGCQFLFTREDIYGNTDLFVTDLTGSTPRQVMIPGPTGALRYRVQSPQWSPRGDRIVFTYVRFYNPSDEPPYRATHIAWVPPEGGEPRFYSNSGRESQPDWSSDGSALVYVSEPEDPDAHRELWVVGADGTGKRRLVWFGDADTLTPRWAPHDLSISFIHQPVNGVHRLMIMSADGSAAAEFLHNQAVTILDYDWRPGAQSIVASMMGFQNVEHNTLWQFPIDNAQVPVQLFPAVEPRYFDFPRYSGDGRWLAFRQAYQLAVYSLRDSQIQSYGIKTGNNSPPAWSPAAFQGEDYCP